MRWHAWLLVVVLVVAIMTAGASKALARMTRSGSASKYGLDNSPSTPEEKRRVLWLDDRRAELLRLMRARFPSLSMSSAYRSPEVNAKVDGAGGGTATRADDSLHTFGLALDFSDGSASYVEHARFLKANAAKLGVQPRTVIAEVLPPHLHIDYSDPLGIMHKPGEVKNRKTSWLQERPGRKRGQSRGEFLGPV